MRNLKRALSLTLASVMLLGMMVLGTSAASYPDVTDEHNVEAIEVLQAIGVMSGSNSGNFNPDSKVTRIEMAIVMANLLDLDVDYFQGQNQFSDVPAWASGYVNACAASGIVTGVGGGRFGTGNVTATQAALMMLKALGYFQYNSDFGGDWARATALQASKINLFNGIKAQDNTQLDRNQVAQLALNTLQATMVDAEDNTLHITTGEDAGNLNISGGSVKYIVRTAATDKVGKAIKSNDSQGNSSSQLNGETLELGEQLYQGDLVRQDNQTDDFGRPAITWKLKSAEIGTYEDTSDLVTTFNGKVTKKDMYQALSKSTIDKLNASSSPSTLTYYVDSSTPTTTINNGTNIDHFIDRNNTGKINDDAADTGNGSVTKVYVDKDDNVTISVVNTYVYQAASDYNTSSKELRVTAAGDTNTYAINLDNYTLKGEEFDLEDIKADDYLLITAYKSGTTYKVASVDKAEVVTGEVTGYRLEDNITLDDKDYSYSLKTEKNGGVKSEIQSTGAQVALVLDKYGYVIAVDSTLVGGNYVFIADADNVVSFSNVLGHAYFPDGTQEDITIKKVGTSTSKSDLLAARGWYTYSKDSTDKYTLNIIKTSNDPQQGYKTAYQTGATAVVNGTKVLVKGNSKLADITGASGIKTNSRTLFVIVDPDGDAYTYTGTSNAPGIELTGGNYQAGYVWNGKTGYASYVFISTDGNKAASVDTATENDAFYFLTKLDATKGTGDDTYYIYKAVIDGVETKIETDSTYPVMRLYTKIKVDSKTNRIVGMKEVAVDSTNAKWAKFTITNDSIKGEKDGLTIGTRSFLADNDSQLTMVINKGASATTDKDASYEVHGKQTPGSINGTLLDQKVTGGYYYIVTKDDYDNGTGNTELKHLFLYVNASSNTENAQADVDAAKAAINKAADTSNGKPGLVVPAPATGANLDAQGIKDAVEALIQQAAGDNVTVSVAWGTATPAAGSTDGSATTGTVTITSKIDGTKTDATLTGLTATVKHVAPLPANPKLPDAVEAPAADGNGKATVQPEVDNATDIGSDLESGAGANGSMWTGINVKPGAGKATVLTVTIPYNNLLGADWKTKKLEDGTTLVYAADKYLVAKIENPSLKQQTAGAGLSDGIKVVGHVFGAEDGSTSGSLRADTDTGWTFSIIYVEGQAAPKITFSVGTTATDATGDAIYTLTIDTSKVSFAE